MAVILIPVGNQYVKKEDAPEFFKNHKKSIVIIAFIYTFLPLLFIFMLTGKVSSLSPAASIYVLWGKLFFIASIIAYLITAVPSAFSQRDSKNFQERLSKFKTGEMIKTTDLLDRKKITTGTILYLGLFAVGLILYILPIILLSQ